MTSKIDFNFKLSDLDKFFEVVKLLDDREGLVEKFRPEVNKYFEKARYFPAGIQRTEYRNAFPTLITALIRDELVNTLHLTPEEILLITDQGFLDMLTDGYLFNPDNYKEIQ